MFIVVGLAASAALVAMGAPDQIDPQDKTSTASPDNRFGLSTPRERPAGTIRIATYNILNFFDREDDPGLSGEFDDMKLAATDERAAKLAEAIRAIDADVIALQEVESLGALEWFRDNWLADMGYTHLASIDVGYFRGIECSVMSRFEITQVKVWPDLRIDDELREGPGWTPNRDSGEPMRFQRSPIMVDVRTDAGYELTLFSIHQKSGNFRHQREFEALKIMQLVKQREAEDPSRNIVVLGDFNAAPWDKSFRVYLERGMVDTLAHRIIPRWQEDDLTEANLYKTHESDRVLDYILLNRAAYREFVPGSAFVYGTLFPPADYNWRTDPHPPGYASDHYPVVIDLIPEDRK